MKTTVNVKLSPEQLAEEFWNMDSEEQARFYKKLMNEAGSHFLILQSIAIRESCERIGKDALDGFQYMGSSAFEFVKNKE